jgi:hypothetical protein
MDFVTYSAAGDSALGKFLSLSPQAERDPLTLLHRRTASCGYKISLIAADELLEERLDSAGGEKRPVRLLWQAWQDIRNDPLGGSLQQGGWNRIDQIGDRLQPENGINEFPLLRRSRQFGSRDHFYVFLTGAEVHGLPGYELSFLCSLCQVEGGSLPVHAAGVIHQRALYLFAGVSGAGKSTVAGISERNADLVLDDDQLLVQRLEDGRFSARAWGYGTQAAGAPLKAVFFLFQDLEEQLQPLSKASVARLLFHRCLDIMGNTVLSSYSQKAFNLAAGIARTVPGYELHFRKSPDFWKLIDNVMPDK